MPTADDAPPRREKAPPGEEEEEEGSYKFPDDFPTNDDAPPRREKGTPCAEEEPPFEFPDGFPVHLLFVRESGHVSVRDIGDVPFALAFREPGVFSVLKAVILKWYTSFFTPPPPPMPQTEILRSAVKEELQKQTIFLMQKFDLVLKTVDSTIRSTVRNESHMKKIQRNFTSFEASVKEVVNKAKSELSLEMKELFEAKVKDLKAVPEESFIQKADSWLKDLETMETFPDRISKLAEKTFAHLAKLVILFEVINLTLKQQSQQATKDPQLDPKNDQLDAELEKLRQLESKLKLLPEICQPFELEKGTYADIGRSSADLLHSYYPSGDLSEYYFSYSADPSDCLRTLMLGAEGPLSINVEDFGPLSLRLKSVSKNGDNVIAGTMVTPQFFLDSVSGTVSIPFPVSHVKGKVHYLNEFGGVVGKLQLGAHPLVKLSAIFGMSAFAVGSDIGYNPERNMLTKSDLGFRYSDSGFDVVLQTKNLLDTISGSVCYKWGVNAFGLQESYTISSGLHQFFLGGSRKLDAATTLKVRLGLEWPVGKAADAKKSQTPDAEGSQAAGVDKPAATMSKAKKSQTPDAEGSQAAGVDKPAATKSKALGGRVVGALALVRQWGSCVAGLSCQVELHLTERPSSPKFGAFVEFGAPKKSSM